MLRCMPSFRYEYASIMCSSARLTPGGTFGIRTPEAGQEARLGRVDIFLSHENAHTDRSTHRVYEIPRRTRLYLGPSTRHETNNLLSVDVPGFTWARDFILPRPFMVFIVPRQRDSINMKICILHRHENDRWAVSITHHWRHCREDCVDKWNVVWTTHPTPHNIDIHTNIQNHVCVCFHVCLLNREKIPKGIPKLA